MVHTMQAPECGHGVEEHVLQVDSEIERDHGQRNARPYRQPERMHQAPPSRLRDQRQAYGRRRKNEAHQHRIEDDDANVARPACTACQLQLAARSKDLPSRHSCEDADEDKEPNERLVAKKEVGSWSHDPPQPTGLTANCYTFKLFIE
jgi:hypothetical protein